MTGFTLVGERTAEDLRGDVGVGRAARVREQAAVVRLRGVLLIDAEPVGEPHGDQRRVQPVLEGKAHAQVRAEAQRRDQFGCADALAALRLIPHAMTVALRTERHADCNIRVPSGVRRRVAPSRATVGVWSTDTTPSRARAATAAAAGIEGTPRLAGDEVVEEAVQRGLEDGLRSAGRLVAALNQAADAEPDPVQKTKLRRAAEAPGSVSAAAHHPAPRRWPRVDPRRARRPRRCGRHQRDHPW
jgi:hypothetical protein